MFKKLNKRNILLLLSLLVLIPTIFIVVHFSTTKAVAGFGFSRPSTKIIPPPKVKDDSKISGYKDYSLSTGGNLIPDWIQFNSSYKDEGGNPSPQYKFYYTRGMANFKFQRVLHLGEFNIYSIIPPNRPSTWNLDWLDLLENRDSKTVKSYLGKYYYADSWDPMLINKNSNIKGGYVDDNSKRWDNYTTPGRCEFWGKKCDYDGKKYEGWFEPRYLGYTPQGAIIFNPYFPVDIQRKKEGKWSPLEYNWDKTPWRYKYIDKGDWDKDKSTTEYKYKANAIEKYLFLEYPGMKTRGDKNYWADRLSMMSDPADGGVIVFGGTHHVGGKLFYAMITVTAKKDYNLRLTELTVKDKETGNVLATVKRNQINNYEMSTKTTYNIKTVKMGKQNIGVLDPYKEYTVIFTIKNMNTNLDKNGNLVKSVNQIPPRPTAVKPLEGIFISDYGDVVGFRIEEIGIRYNESNLKL